MHNETKLPPYWWLNPWKWVRFYEAAYRMAYSEVTFADENCDEARSELLEASEKIAALIKERDAHKSSSELFYRNYVQHNDSLERIRAAVAKELGTNSDVLAGTERLVATVIRVKQENESRLREELSKTAKVLVKAPGNDVSWKKPTPAKPKPKAKKATLRTASVEQLVKLMESKPKKGGRK